MHSAQEHMVIRGHAKYARAKQWRPVKVERSFHFLLGEAVGLGIGFRRMREIAFRNTQSEITSNELPQFPTFQSERCAQAIVTLNHFLQAVAERGETERSSQPETQMNVISGTITLKLVEKP